MDGWFGRFREWWRQGNAIAMLTGERGLDEVRGERAPEPGQGRPDTGQGRPATGSGEAHPIDGLPTRDPDGATADPSADGGNVPGAGS